MNTASTSPRAQPVSTGRRATVVMVAVLAVLLVANYVLQHVFYEVWNWAHPEPNPTSDLSPLVRRDNLRFWLGVVMFPAATGVIAGLVVIRRGGIHRWTATDLGLSLTGLGALLVQLSWTSFWFRETYVSLPEHLTRATGSVIGWGIVLLPPSLVALATIWILVVYLPRRQQQHRWPMLSNTWSTREALSLAFVSALGAASCVALTSTVFGGPAGAKLVVYGIGWCFVIACALRSAAEKGLLFLWVVAAAGWLAGLLEKLSVGSPGLGAAIELLPEWFTSWNSLILPLVPVTAFALLRHGTYRSRAALVVPAAWLVLALLSTIFASHPSDVRGSPRGNPLLAWPAAVVAVVAPALLVSWAIRALWGKGEREGQEHQAVHLNG